MGFGPVVFVGLDTVDVTEPGMVTVIGVEQIDNTTAKLRVRLPDRDADDSELTGLTRMVVAVKVDPFISEPDGGSMDACLAEDGVDSSTHMIVDLVGGSEFEVTVNLLSAGMRHYFAIACSDD